MGDDVNKRKTGRVKRQVVRIENDAKRQLTFSRRRNGLIKKAYELSVLCDIDVALIMFSPSGRLSLFSGKRRCISTDDHSLSLNVQGMYTNIQKPSQEAQHMHAFVIVSIIFVFGFSSNVEYYRNIFFYPPAIVKIFQHVV